MGRAMADFDATLAAAQEGAPGAFDVLYASLVRQVAAYLRARGVREVEDTTSEVFLDVFRGLTAFVGDEAGFRSWVFTIAHRRAVDSARRAGRTPTSVMLVDEAHDRAVASAEDSAIDAMAAERVRRVLAHLTDEQREVLLLRVVADLTVDQVAELVGRSPGAVKALQARGLEAVRRAVGPDAAARASALPPPSG